LSDRGWIAVDFDRTLAVYETWEEHGMTPGPPIPLMVDRVKGWLATGIDVRILTARVAPECQSEESRLSQEIVLRAWCQKHLGRELALTHAKDFQMLELWDDRAVQVEPNTGRRMDGKE
jgi:hypothetical protein